MVSRPEIQRSCFLLWFAVQKFRHHVFVLGFRCQEPYVFYDGFPSMNSKLVSFVMAIGTDFQKKKDVLSWLLVNI